MKGELYRKLRLTEQSTFRVINPPSNCPIELSGLVDTQKSNKRSSAATNVLCFVASLDALPNYLDDALDNTSDDLNLTIAFPAHEVLGLGRHCTFFSALLKNGFRQIAMFELYPGCRAVRFLKYKTMGVSNHIDMGELERCSAEIKQRYLQLA